MTDARELLKQGQLSKAIAQLTQDVKSKPTDVPSRIFLFELLSFDGDLDRAAKQLEVVGHQSVEMQVGTQIYQRMLTAERARRSIFCEKTPPNFLASPPEYAPLHVEALSLIQAGEAAKARALLEDAISRLPVLAGTANGKPFEEFGDSDPFLGPFLELILNDRYAWLPFDQIKRIEIKKPAYLRDLIWIGAKIEARTGDLGEVFLPVLYARSHEHANEAVKLGRMTDWIDVGEKLVRGAGQRLFLIDGEEIPVLEINEIAFSC